MKVEGWMEMDNERWMDGDGMKIGDVGLKTERGEETLGSHHQQNVKLASMTLCRSGSAL